MKTKYYFSILAGMLLATPLAAQKLSVEQHRQFNLDVLRTLDTYESCSALYDNAARMDFDMLFQDHSLYIFNDLNGLSAAPMLSVSDYSELLNSKGKSTQVIIKNLKKGAPYYDDGWKMDVSFDKEITYANACEILFSSKNFFGADFHIDMTLLWDEDMRECYICKLDGRRGSEIQMLPQEYSILTHTSERDFKVRADGDTLAFNSFGQAFLSAHPKITYPDQDVRIKAVVENEDCNTISLLYTPKRWRIKGHYDLLLGDIYNADGEELPESSSMEFGVDAGYIIPSKGFVKWGVFFGLGFAFSKMDMSIDQYSYSYSANSSSDVDGDPYTRHYDIEHLSQTFKSTDLVIPFYLDMDFRCGNNFSIYLDAGVKAYLNMKNSLAINSGTYSTYGVYPQYGNLVMRPESHWLGTPINGFVTNANIASNNADFETETNGFSVDFLGRGGFRYLIHKNLFLDFGASYQTGLTSPFPSNTTDNKAIMTYTVARGETVNSLLNHYSGLKRQALTINIGIMYRF